MWRETGTERHGSYPNPACPKVPRTSQIQNGFRPPSLHLGRAKHVMLPPPTATAGALPSSSIQLPSNSAWPGGQNGPALPVRPSPEAREGALRTRPARFEPRLATPKADADDDSDRLLDQRPPALQAVPGRIPDISPACPPAGAFGTQVKTLHPIYWPGPSQRHLLYRCLQDQPSQKQDRVFFRLLDDARPHIAIAPDQP